MAQVAYVTCALGSQIIVFKMHGAIDIGSVAEVRRCLTSYDQFQLYDY